MSTFSLPDAGQETRPYGAISVVRDMIIAAAMKPRLSLQKPNGAVKTAVGAALCGRPSPVAGHSLVHPAGFWNGSVRHTPTRTLCHGWSEPGAAVKWHRPKFCTAPGPSGPEGIIPGTIFCTPEILHEGIGVSPVNGGPGENELEPEGTCSRRRCESSPGDPLVSFPSLGKKLALRGEILRVE